MEFKNFIFQAWKVMEFNYRCKKVMENQSFVWQIILFILVILSLESFVSVELFKVKKCAKTKKVL